MNALNRIFKVGIQENTSLMPVMETTPAATLSLPKTGFDIRSSSLVAAAGIEEGVTTFASDDDEETTDSLNQQVTYYGDGMYAHDNKEAYYTLQL